MFLFELDRAFQENFLDRDELGASVSVWQDGELLSEWHDGYTTPKRESIWNKETLVPVYSASKGAASASVLKALCDNGLDPSCLVRHVWAQFPVANATIAEALSHQCGLAALSQPVSLFDYEACVQALEQTSPAWLPPRHGYHPHTFGIITDRIIFGLTGMLTAEFWEQEIRKPLGIDFYLKLPESEFNRVATLIPGKSDMESLNSPFYRQYLTPETPIYQAFHSMLGINSVREMNTPKAWTCGAPALTGVASADGMAQFYQACLGYDNQSIFSHEARRYLADTVIDGYDETLMVPSAFTCGMMKDPIDELTSQTLRTLFGAKDGFGHPGAGGCHAFALPSLGISFAYTMNRMDLNVLPGIKTQSLVDALMRDLG